MTDLICGPITERETIDRWLEGFKRDGDEEA